MLTGVCGTCGKTNKLTYAISPLAYADARKLESVASAYCCPVEYLLVCDACVEPYLYIARINSVDKEPGWFASVNLRYEQDSWLWQQTYLPVCSHCGRQTTMPELAVVPYYDPDEPLRPDEKGESWKIVCSTCSNIAGFNTQRMFYSFTTPIKGAAVAFQRLGMRSTPKEE